MATNLNYTTEIKFEVFMTTKLTTLQHFSGDQPRLFGAEDKSQSQKAKYFPINIVIITDDKNTFAEMCFM